MAATFCAETSLGAAPPATNAAPMTTSAEMQSASIQVTQETLAETIGTTRSRVGFFMNRLRKLGFISYKCKIEVHNSLLNAVLHDTPQMGRD